MKPSTRTLSGFFLAAAITTAAWMAFWPESPQPPAPPAPLPAAPATEASWNKERISDAIRAVGQSAPDEARLNACTDLLRIPAAGVRGALEETELTKGNSLTLAAKILLIRWASEDGQAALGWAWKRFRSDGLWRDAFREIGPAWAAHDPAGLGRWALEAAGKMKPDEEEPTMADAASMEQPFVDSRMLSDIAGWLVTEDPDLAYQLIRKRGGFSSMDMKMPSALFSVDKIHEAVRAFGDMRITSPTRLVGDEVQLYYLLQRWHEIDPDDFDRSSHAGSVVTGSPDQSSAEVRAWEALPAEQRAAVATDMLKAMIPEGRSRRIAALAEAWAKTDPAAAVHWLDSLPLEDAASANLAGIKVSAAHDPAAAFERAGRLPEDGRRDAVVTVFDAWTTAHPGERPDMSRWPDPVVSAWEDLETLLPDGRK